MIYFIEAVGSDCIKIGFTDKPLEGRLALLQTGNPLPLRVLGTMPGTKHDEKKYHRWFRKSHFRGEWHTASQDLLDFVRDCTTEFRMIEEIDGLLSEKLTRYSLARIPIDDSFFRWQSLIESVASGFCRNQSVEETASECRLEQCTTSNYCGWFKGKSARHKLPTYHLFYSRDNAVYRCCGQFYHTGYEMYLLPRTVLKLIPKNERNLRLACKKVWAKAMADQFHVSDLRLYI